MIRIPWQKARIGDIMIYRNVRKKILEMSRHREHAVGVNIDENGRIGFGRRSLWIPDPAVKIYREGEDFMEKKETITAKNKEILMVETRKK